MSDHGSSGRLQVATAVLPGIAAAPGVAVGPALVLAPQQISYVRSSLRSSETEGEVARFRRAVLLAQEELRSLGERSSASRSEQSIIEAYLLMLGDETLASEVERRIHRERQCAEWAVSLAVEGFVSTLSAQSDPYLRERCHDFEFIGERLLMALTGASSRRAMPKLSGSVVLVAHEISPADLLALGREHLLAIATESGTRTCHTAIVARALEIPSVLGVSSLLSRVTSGDRLVVDGLRGSVTVRPTEEMVSSSHRRGQRHEALTRHLLHDIHRRTTLADGEPISLLANIEFSHEASFAVSHGAEGVGLYRTEFLYTDRNVLPSEDEQFEHFRAVLAALDGRPLVFRTFDMGGDKPIGNLSLPPQPNPALGLRAVRLALEHPELLLTQLRAMLRASAEGDVRIMVPMVASLREWREVQRLFEQAKEQIDARRQARARHVPFGIMVEVPSVALLIDHFAPHTEFLSLGTNDLTQYTLAVDRTSPQLSRLASHFDPAVLRLVRGVIQGAQAAHRPLTLCGAMAGDPLAILLLIGLGLRSFSMEPAVLPEIKEALRRVTLAEAQEVAAEAMQQSFAEDVEHLLASQFAHRLIDLLSGGAAD
jgi:phosphotransferase system enzyme I (PtsI)